MGNGQTNDVASRMTARQAHMPGIAGQSSAAKTSKRPTPVRPRTKVKTGCRTCKLRKVKCDEGRPACTRCVSTGRACAGYGIWGGGSSIEAARKPATSTTPAAVITDVGEYLVSPSVPRQFSNGISAPLSSQEYERLDWFRWCTVVKLRGAFSVAFWDVLVIRASFEEPAVLHAALALSTVHRRLGGSEWKDEDVYGSCVVAQSRSEDFTLQQYNKAIRHLMAPSLMRGTLDTTSTTTTTPSIAKLAATRTVLITCMLFTCLEFMRGRFQTGLTHLRNGLRLLSGLFATSHGCKIHSGGVPALNSYSHVRDSRLHWADINEIDRWLLEAFWRMNLSATQFSPGHENLLFPISSQCFFAPDHCLIQLPITFASVSQARNILDQLVCSVFSLAGRARLQEHRPRHSTPVPGCEGSNLLSWSSSTSGDASQSLVCEQAHLVTALDAWQATYRASRTGLYTQSDAGLLTRVAYQMLILYYDMAAIIASTCLAPDMELAFDAHTKGFLTILRNALLFFRTVKDVHNSQDVIFSVDSKVFQQLNSAADTPTEKCLFGVDAGWIPPLYFTALHCRVDRIRRQAVRLFKSIPSREGMWDSQLASAVAEEVIRQESMEITDQSASLFAEHLDKDLFRSDRPDPVLLPLSGSQPRIHNVQVELIDGWPGPTTMMCEKHWLNGKCENIRAVYNPMTQRWSRI